MIQRWFYSFWKGLFWSIESKWIIPTYFGILAASAQRGLQRSRSIRRQRGLDGHRRKRAGCLLEEQASGRCLRRQQSYSPWAVLYPWGVEVGSLYVYIYICIDICVSICTCMCMCRCTCTHTHTCISTYIWIYIYIYIRIHIHIHIHVNIHVNIHVEIQGI